MRIIKRLDFIPEHDIENYAIYGLQLTQGDRACIWTIELFSERYEFIFGVGRDRYEPKKPDGEPDDRSLTPFYAVNRLNVEGNNSLYRKNNPTQYANMLVTCGVCGGEFDELILAGDLGNLIVLQHSFMTAMWPLVFSSAMCQQLVGDTQNHHMFNMMTLKDVRQVKMSGIGERSVKIYDTALAMLEQMSLSGSVQGTTTLFDQPLLRVRSSLGGSGAVISIESTAPVYIDCTLHIDCNLRVRGNYAHIRMFFALMVIEMVGYVIGEYDIIESISDYLKIYEI